MESNFHKWHKCAYAFFSSVLERSLCYWFCFINVNHCENNRSCLTFYSTCPSDNSSRVEEETSLNISLHINAWAYSTAYWTFQCEEQLAKRKMVYWLCSMGEVLSHMTVTHGCGDLWLLYHWFITHNCKTPPLCLLRY